MDTNKPLAERLRPNTLNDYVGQEHLLGKNGVLRPLIENGRLPSIILWGPPGVGKTSLALLLSKILDRNFYNLSAIHSGVKDVRQVIDSAQKNAAFDTHPPILFIDEIHRFSKSQQDSLLAAVERGIVTLVGATTENPSFEVITPLLSRCQVYVLKPLQKEHLLSLVNKAITEDEVLKTKKITLEESDALLAYSGGDARKLLNLLDIVISRFHEDPIILNNERVKAIVKENPLHYDKDGEQHYDIISAFIKSIRGSDPNAAVYWLARMLAGGEDPKFIARRLVILASEDIGNANPNALLLASQGFTSVTQIGMPEARIILSQITTYLASSPKSNASYMAINKAQALVKETGNLEVPLHLRNAPTELMKQLDYGTDYKYPHDYPTNFVRQDYMPKELSGHNLLHMGGNPREQDLEKRLHHLWGPQYNFKKNDSQ